MEIHHPERPIHSFKDFAIHIAVITLGILIALGLDGLREHFRERRLVREARANFNHEFAANRRRSDLELKGVTDGRDKLDAIVKAMPALAVEHPEQLQQQLDAVRNPFFFFAANSWQAALSTGALAHLSPEEVSAYASGTEGVRRYTQVQNDALSAETRAFAQVHAHPHPTPEQAAAELEALLELQRYQIEMAWVCPQMQGDVDEAVRASESH